MAKKRKAAKKAAPAKPQHSLPAGFLVGGGGGGVGFFFFFVGGSGVVWCWRSGA